jgi:hypothetical protein
VYVRSDRLQVRITGQGKLTPNYSNAWLELGKSYSMTASGLNGHTFTNWVLATNWIRGVTNVAPVRFMMQSNLTVQVNFADVTRPTATISSPTAGQRWSNAVFTVKGTAKDNAAVAVVRYQLNGGVWTDALGTTNWTATLTLTPGTNTVRVYAADPTGNRSATNGVSFLCVTRGPLQVGTTNAEDLVHALDDRDLTPARLQAASLWLDLPSLQPDGSWRVTVHSPAGAVCEVWISTDLTHWVHLHTLTNATGAGSFLDSATELPQRFYRVRQLPSLGDAARPE